MRQLIVKRIDDPSVLEQQGSEGVIDCVNWAADFPYKPKVSFKIGYTQQSICILFNVEEQNVKAVCLDANGPVWEDSCVEFFVKQEQSPYYFNFETNCIGVGLSAKRLSRDNKEFLNQQQSSRIIRKSSLASKAVDFKNGKWSLYLEIPFDIIGLSSIPRSLRANFYKCGDKTDPAHYISWNPIATPTADFHRPEYFGELIFD